MKKRTAIMTLVIVIALSITAFAGVRSLKFYKQLVKRNKIAKVREYWNENLTASILENRGDDIIIEKIIGTVVDEQKNGRLLNPVDPQYDYISYKRVKGAKTGDVILTVCIYTPGNSYTDDICERFDYIIESK